MLTYSCPVHLEQNPIPSKEDLMSFLKELRNVEKCVVCREVHENGKYHFHAALTFNPKCSTRDVTFFDFSGVHPNIGTRENWKAMVAYVTKDGDFVCHNFDPGNVTGRRKESRDDIYKQALKLAFDGKLEDAKRLVRDSDPMRWCMNMSQISSALLASYHEGKAQSNPVVVLEDRWVTPLVTIDLTARLEGEGWIRTHVLVGESGIGKTEFAKFLLRKAGCQRIEVVRSAEMLKTMIDSVDGFVFDELNCNAPDVRGGRWTRESQIALVDRNEEGALPARYSDVHLKRHIVRIVTTNSLHRALDWQDGAIARRITVHDLGNVRLFN